jgi:hypothetical protein
LPKKFKGLLLTLEHRYYGESQPFQELTTDNLKYLSSKQALFDLAYFVQHFKEKFRISHNKLFTIGCSYAGALSAWFRLKFPHLTKGSLSSSGVVNAILDFTAFDEQVSLSLKEECSSCLRKASHEIEFYIKNSSKSNVFVKTLFSSENFDDNDFLYLIADIGAESVQYGFQEQLCNYLSSKKNLDSFQLMIAYAEYTKQIFYPNFGNNNGYRTSQQQNIKPPNADRAWWWQTCTELAYFQTAPRINSIRSSSINLDWYKKKCEIIFGKTVWPNTNITNLYYGGKNIAATNIFFINSSQDPWQRASVENSQLYEPFHLIECFNCGHCSDLRGCPSLPNQENLYGCNDPYKHIEKARELIFFYINKWLNE